MVYLEKKEESGVVELFLDKSVSMTGGDTPSPSGNWATKEYVDNKVGELAGNVYTKEEVDELVKDFGAVVIENGKTYTEEDVEKIKKTKLVAILDTNLTYYKISTVLGKDYLSGYWYGSTQIPINVESVAWSLNKDGDVYKASVSKYTYNMDNRIRNIANEDSIILFSGKQLSDEQYNKLMAGEYKTWFKADSRLIPVSKEQNGSNFYGTYTNPHTYTEKLEYRTSIIACWVENVDGKHIVKSTGYSSSIWHNGEYVNSDNLKDVYTSGYINKTFYTKDEVDALIQNGANIVIFKDKSNITKEQYEAISNGKAICYYRKGLYCYPCSIKTNLKGEPTSVICSSMSYTSNSNKPYHMNVSFAFTEAEDGTYTVEATEKDINYLTYITIPDDGIISAEVKGNLDSGDIFVQKIGNFNLIYNYYDGVDAKAVYSSNGDGTYLNILKKHFERNEDGTYTISTTNKAINFDDYYTKEECDAKYALKGEGGVEGIKLTNGLILTAEQYENIITGKANALLKVINGRTEEWAIANIRIKHHTTGDIYLARVRALLTDRGNTENTDYTLLDSEASFELQEDGTYKCVIVETSKGVVKDIILPYSSSKREITKELYDAINPNYAQNIFLRGGYGYNDNVALGVTETSTGKEAYTYLHNQSNNKNYLLKVSLYKDAEDEKYYTEPSYTEIGVQQFKTINNQSILGEGNIEIGGGTEGTTEAEVRAIVEGYGFAKEEDVPTKTSELTNDSGFLTEHQSLEEYAKKSEIPTVPTNVSAFNNDAGYLTEHQSLDGYATEQWVEDKNYLTEHQSLDEYAKKSEIPTIPSNVSAFNNDAGYLTEHQSLSDYYTKEDIDYMFENNIVYVFSDENTTESIAKINDFLSKYNNNWTQQYKERLIIFIKAGTVLSEEASEKAGRVVNINGIFPIQWRDINGSTITANIDCSIGKANIAISSNGIHIINVFDFISKPTISQSTGDSTTAIMSQKAATDAFALKTEIPSLDNYVLKKDIVQSTGTSTTAVMSQKAATDTFAKVKKLTQAQYNALTTKDNNTIYIING